MLEIDDKEDPNFGDSDYQLAAYAAALRVVTAYSAIEDIDVERELRRVRKAGESSPLADMIRSAVRIASDFLVPDGLDSDPLEASPAGGAFLSQGHRDRGPWGIPRRRLSGIRPGLRCTRLSRSARKRCCQPDPAEDARRTQGP